MYLNACCADAVLIGLQHSKQLLWGWYTLRFYPPDALIEAIAKRLTPLVHNMDARTVSEFIWAFGGLNYEPSNMQLFLQVCLRLVSYTGLAEKKTRLTVNNLSLVPIWCLVSSDVGRMTWDLAWVALMR